MRNFLLIYVNGQRHQIYGEHGFQSLSDFLRIDLGLIGTKVVCAEGDCGSCTVLIGRVRNCEMYYEGIDSCIQYLYQLDCVHVITVEGLKEESQKIHPVQQAIIDSIGSQCGYCTPGFVMSLVAMLEKNETLTRHSVQDGLTGNLCRCTGYEQIIDAALSLNPDVIPKVSKRFDVEAMIADFTEHATQPVFCDYDEKWNGVASKIKFFIPTSIEEAVEFKQKNKNVTIVAGGTDISVQMNKERLEPNCVMSLTHLTGLELLEIKNRIMTIGAKVTWAKLGEFCQKHLPELAEIISIFGSIQIRNAGTLAGNIANASPIADCLPLLHVIEAEIELTGSQGTRWVNINQFYQGYKNTVMTQDELITSIRWTLHDPTDVLKLYKVSKRKDLDISTFTAGILLKLKNGKMQGVCLAYGGVGPVVIRLPKTEKFLLGKPMMSEIFQEAGKIAREEIYPISDVRASTDYRSQLAENILMKFFHECCVNQNKKEAA